jgi:hypothetical protein
MAVHKMCSVFFVILLAFVFAQVTGKEVPLEFCGNVNSTAQLCSATHYRYAYCTSPAICDVDTKICSGNRNYFYVNNQVDNSPVRHAFTKPVYLPEKLSHFFMNWGAAVMTVGLFFIIVQRNKQPMRTRNYYLIVVELFSQFLLVRMVMGQQEYDYCFLSNSVNVVGLSCDRSTLLAQVRFYRILTL